KRHGLKTKNIDCEFEFSVERTEKELRIHPITGCRATKDGTGMWTIQAANGDFVIREYAALDALPVTDWKPEKNRYLEGTLSLVLCLLLLLFLLPKNEIKVEE